ncbi:MAG: TlpA family protein disulfide reductase [Acidimicrobiaceae bacterium]|nr:TlpA family protein disulfide reductase [Acidimicrobiaceae bacterium]
MTTLSSGPQPAGSAPEPLGSPVPRRPRSAPRRRKRLAVWISLAAAVVVAVLIAFLASAKPSSEQLVNSPLLGKAAPTLHGSAILNGPAGGGPVRLSTYRGRWVLVNFAASWCVPCAQEMPQLLLFARQHAASGNATILTVADDQGDIANLRQFLRARSASWPAVDDSNATVNWGVGQLPNSYMVDPAGTVVAEVEGGVNASQLDALIAKYSRHGS